MPPSQSPDHFRHGPLFSLVNAIGGQTPGRPPGAAPDPVEWEVLRYRRLVSVFELHAVGRQDPVSVAAQLDDLSRTFDEEAFRACPPQVRFVWERAAGASGVPDFLATLADLMRIAATGPVPDYEDVPLAYWEARERFPDLSELHVLLEAGDYASDTDGIRDLVVTTRHPGACAARVPAVAAQALEALALCARSADLQDGVTAFLHLTPARLALVADTAYTHMKTDHRPPTDHRWPCASPPAYRHVPSPRDRHSPMQTRSSTYPDRATAHWATQQVVTQNEQDINRWLAQGTRDRLVIEAAWPSRDEPVGRVLLQAMLLAGREPVDVRAARVVLKRDPASANGFAVHATFPVFL